MIKTIKFVFFLLASKSKNVIELYLVLLRNIILHLKDTIIFVGSENHLLDANSC